MAQVVRVPLTDLQEMALQRKINEIILPPGMPKPTIEQFVLAEVLNKVNAQVAAFRAQAREQRAARFDLLTPEDAAAVEAILDKYPQ